MRGLFDDNIEIKLWAYNIETIMAEKIETILQRSVLNTRARDFYDVFILSTAHDYDKELLLKAIAATALHRNSTEQISNAKEILTILEKSNELEKMWSKYRRDFPYAKEITYVQVIATIKDLVL